MLMFEASLSILYKSFLEKGYTKDVLLSIFNKFICNYPKEWGKFGTYITVPGCLR